jgi:hypothetical protein
VTFRQNIRKLVLQEESIQIKTGENKSTALVWDSWGGHYEIYQLLLENRADVFPWGGFCTRYQLLFLKPSQDRIAAARRRRRP